MTIEMKPPSLYMETTIPSYLMAEPSRDILAAARQEITRTWWSRDHAHFNIFISDVVVREAEKGDRRAARKRREFLERFPVLEASPGVQRLTDAFLSKGIVPFGSAEDAAHLAFATFYSMEFLCTWNFKHLANVFAVRRLRQFNERRGLFVPQVCTPEELLGD